MSETTDLYALAAPARDAALREINGAEVSAEDRACEALQAHLTAVIFAYLGARLGRCGEIAMSDEAFARLDGAVALDVAADWRLSERAFDFRDHLRSSP